MKIEIQSFPKRKCENFKLVTFVKTGRNNLEMRKLVREMTLFDIQPYFIIGTGPGSVEDEQTENGDLIVGNFPDIYENLPLKTMLGYQFANDECKDIKYFFYQGMFLFCTYNILLTVL